MDDVLQNLLKDPWQVQLAIGSGFAAYAISYSGIRSHHKTVEIAFSTLAFGLISTFVVGIALARGWSPLEAGTIAFFSAVAAGMVWRKCGRDLLSAALRAADISWSDNDVSAFAKIAASTHSYVSQIAVELDDGTWLSCADTRPFASGPFGACVLGDEGDVALYVTQVTDKDGVETATSAVTHPEGLRLTYVPAARIRTINLRHLKKGKGWRSKSSGA